MRIVFLYLLLFSFKAVALECKPTRFPHPETTKIEILNLLEKKTYQDTFNYFIYEITDGQNIEKANIFYQHLKRQSERKKDLQLLELLAHSSYLKKDLKKLNEDEVCKLVKQVNALK